MEPVKLVLKIVLLAPVDCVSLAQMVLPSLLEPALSAYLAVLPAVSPISTNA